MLSLIRQIFSDRKLAFVFFGAFSVLALSAAYIGQYVFGLLPCPLCIYQRIAYGMVVLLAASALALGARAGHLFSGLIAFTFSANAMIAFYHSGVERHWWRSFLEGCTVPKIDGDVTDILAQIAQTPLARCDEIPWADPVVGLSMANYNVLACLVMAAAALYTFTRRA